MTPGGRPGALAEPVVDALRFQHQTVIMVARQHRVVSAQALHETAVARHRGLGHDDPVKWTFFGTAAGQANFQCHGLITPSEPMRVGRRLALARKSWRQTAAA